MQNYPHPSDESVSLRMRQNPRRDTRPERALRSALHLAGLRFRVDYRLDAADVVVRPDVVFTRARVAVFIDGCFWHACPTHGNKPRHNSHYWSPKLDRNVARDRKVTEALSGAGWDVIRVWEHDPVDAVVERVTKAVRARV